MPLLLALVACGQVDPFTNPDFTEPGPFNPNPPVRLTYNPGPDVQPAFLRRGQIVFGFARPGEFNGDQCLGVLPNAGGTTLSESCPRTAGSRDSTERYGEARPLDDATVALVLGRRVVGRRVDDDTWIGTAPWRSATEFTPRLRFPLPGPSGILQYAPTYLSLVGNRNAAYLATDIAPACPGLSPVCDTFTLVTYGREVGLVNLASDAPPSVLPEAEYATSIAPGQTSGAVLFTRAADLSVYQRDASGAVTTLATVPGTVAVRDPALSGARLVSVVDGTLAFFTLADGRLLQLAGGGSLVLTDLASGNSTVLATGSWSRPTLSEDGRQLVAESGDDIYRFDLP